MKFFYDSVQFIEYAPRGPCPLFIKTTPITISVRTYYRMHKANACSEGNPFRITGTVNRVTTLKGAETVETWMLTEKYLQRDRSQTRLSHFWHDTMQPVTFGEQVLYLSMHPLTNSEDRARINVAVLSVDKFAGFICRSQMV